MANLALKFHPDQKRSHFQMGDFFEVNIVNDELIALLRHGSPWHGVLIVHGPVEVEHVSEYVIGMGVAVFLERQSFSLQRLHAAWTAHTA